MKLTQAELAHEIGVARNTVTRWEIGLSAISEPMAKLIRMTAAKHKPKNGAERVSGSPSARRQCWAWPSVHRSP